MNPEEIWKKWMEAVPLQDPLHDELVSMENDHEKIRDCFSGELSFGTAGLRGISGAGTARMNRFTVARATAGLADYIRETEGTGPVVIAFDCRHYSRAYAELAARVLAAAEIPVQIFPDIRSTPELSFAVRRLHAAAGINMTASHNPKEYNGYKIYWNDGAQISGTVSRGIAEKIGERNLLDPVPEMERADALGMGLLEYLTEEEDQAYLDYVLSQGLHHGEADLDPDISLVYTPLNGAGSRPVKLVMAARGFRRFFTVPEQENPDPDFSTVGYPNPENPAAFRLAEQYGAARRADLLIATDPDSDRMAVEVPGRGGGYHFLNGNQTGALLIYYKAASLKAAGKLTGREAMIKSIVTGDFGREICKSFGISVFEALTGFKNICGRIPELEEKGYRYFFGYEESIGCAPGEAVRDKDGITAGMLLAEMAAFYKRKGLTLAEVVEALYQQYGYFAEKQISLIREGPAGQREILEKMAYFRDRASEKTLNGLAVAGCTDYREGYGDIPPADVLKFVLEDGSWFAVRPSGTEPKLKFYFYTRKSSRGEAEARLTEMTAALQQIQ